MSTFAPQTEKNDENLAVDLQAFVEKLPHDLVRCTRVFGNFYRCNWWARVAVNGHDNPEMAGGQLGTAHRVRKSQLLRAVRTADGLNVEPVRGN